MHRTLALMERMAVALGAAASLVALVVRGPELAGAVGLGALIGVGNFRLLHTVMGRLLLGEGDRLGSKVLLAALASLKFLLLVGVVVAALVWLSVDRLGFVIGISAIVVAIPIGGLWHGGGNGAPVEGSA
jgi:hypothetical protein